MYPYWIKTVLQLEEMLKHLKCLKHNCDVKEQKEERKYNYVENKDGSFIIKKRILNSLFPFQHFIYRYRKEINIIKFFLKSIKNKLISVGCVQLYWINVHCRNKCVCHTWVEKESRRSKSSAAFMFCCDLLWSFIFSLWAVCSLTSSAQLKIKQLTELVITHPKSEIKIKAF